MQLPFYPQYQQYKSRYPGIVQFIKFCLVGFSGVFVDMGIVLGVKELWGLDTRLAALLGFWGAVSSNYVLNRCWSFAQARSTPFFKHYCIFVGVCSVGLAVRIMLMHLLIEYANMDQGRWYLVNNFLGIMVATAVNFTGSKYLAFAPTQSSGECS